MDKRKRRDENEFDRRLRLENLYESGITNPRKLSDLTNIHLSNVYRNIKKIEEGKGIERQPGSGRPRILQANDRRRVYQIAKKNPYMSATKISFKAASLGSPKVSNMTILRTLNEQKVFKFVPKKVASLTERNIEKRIIWCQKYKNFDWTKVVFTDESHFHMYEYKLAVWAKERPEKMVKKYTPSVGIWGGICSLGKSIMKTYKGTINSEIYIQILNECLVEEMNMLYGDEEWFLQQDNASSHVSKFSREEMKKLDIKVIDWASESSDLNIIEEIWAIMKRRVEQKNPRYLEEFKEVIQEVWNEITPEFIKSYIDSMPNRIEKCLLAKGGRFE
jgi:hypothetical protein